MHFWVSCKLLKSDDQLMCLSNGMGVIANFPIFESHELWQDVYFSEDFYQEMPLLGVAILPSVWCIWVSYQSQGGKSQGLFQTETFRIKAALVLDNSLDFMAGTSLISGEWSVKVRAYLITSKESIPVVFSQACELIKHSLSHGENLSFSNW